MTNRNKTSLILALLILAGAFLILTKISYKKQQEPAQGPSASYPQGTKVEAFKDFPEGFPKEVVLENKTLETADTVKFPDGKQNITVVYISQKPLVELMGQYFEHLNKNGWNVKANQILERSGVILASKEAGELTITVAPVSSGTMVTFSYKK